ncbi:MAG TPA: hypothetical protein VM433_09905 [Mycobacteriales bacterium]|nr:hypothetical protein [Mycobacteriales bacterium]
MTARSLPRRAGLALGLTAALALGLPAGADDTCYTRVVDGPQFCTTQVWFVPAETKVGNLAATGATSYPTWTGTAPTQSVAQGAGGGYATNGVQRQQNAASDPATGALFKGTHTGRLDNLAVTMYLFAPAKQNDPTYYGGVDVVVDGKVLLTIDTDGLPLSSGGNAVLKTDFAVTNLHRAMERAGLDTSAEAVHDVELFLTSYTLATTTSVFVYGTTEAPSTMVFNVKDLAGRATLPA